MSKKTFQAEIEATHPMEARAGEFELRADELAWKLVGERHAKADLVDLVRWLITRNAEGLIEKRMTVPEVKRLEPWPEPPSGTVQSPESEVQSRESRDGSPRPCGKHFTQPAVQSQPRSAAFLQSDVADAVDYVLNAGSGYAEPRVFVQAVIKELEQQS